MMTGEGHTQTRNSTFWAIRYTFRQQRSKNRRGKFFINFSPAVSDQAVKPIRAEIRGWNLHVRSDQSIEDLSRMYNPVIRGWFQFYGAVLPVGALSAHAATARTLARCAEQKSKKLRGHLRRATHWIARIMRRDLGLFAPRATARAAWLIPFNERHLHMTIQDWTLHHNRARPHSALGPRSA
jgi:RNA-directed DNA polymerase